MHEPHSLPLDYEHDNPIVTISLTQEQMEKFAQNELNNNSPDSDAYRWLLTEADPEDREKIEKLIQNEIWTLLTEGLHDLDALLEGLYEAYNEAYQASGTIPR
jgi:pyruvate dehydrogenase complex dehydrogenase (E1) component